MTRKEELNKMSVLHIMDLMKKYKIEPKCKHSEAIERILEAEKVTKEKKKRPPRNSASTKLKAARIKAGMTQSQLAEMAEMNVRTLQHYEQGSKCFDNARIDAIFKVCLALDCKLDDIVENSDYLKLIKEYMKKETV